MKATYILFFVILLIPILSDANPPVAEGKAIFSARCAACHNINKILTGPALAGVDQRRTPEWIVNFVQSSQSMIKSGDKEAVALFKKFNNIPMPDHKDLTESQIQSVVEYIKSEAKPAAEETVPFARPGRVRPNYLPVSADNYGFFLTCFGLLVLLIGSLLLAVRVKEYERSLRSN